MTATPHSLFIDQWRAALVGPRGRYVTPYITFDTHGIRVRYFRNRDTPAMADLECNPKEMVDLLLAWGVRYGITSEARQFLHL